MSIERVGQVLPALAAQRQGSGSRLPATLSPPATVGERLALELDGADAEGLWLRHEQGGRWRMPLPGGWPPGLSVGDVVWVRVLAVAPQLELEWLPSTRSTALAPPTGDLPAMRMDQAGLRGHHWHLPPANELAAAWRVMLRAHGLLSPGASPTRALPGAPGWVGAAVPGSGWAGGMAAALGTPVGPDWHWDFPVYAWGGLNITLRVRAVEEGEPREGEADEASQASTWLELLLMLPGLGAVRLQIQATHGGVALALLPRQAQALPLLREVLPEVATVLARLGAPLQRCELAKALPRPVRARSAARAARVVHPLLLGAAAEVAAVLARHWPGVPDPGVNPANPPP